MDFLKKIWSILLLHLLFLFVSVSGVLGKLTANEPFFSSKFMMLYAVSLAVLVVYSFFWQILLKSFSLNVAYAHRSIVTVWGVAWGILIFHESISIGKVAATALIVIGVVFTNNG